MVVVRLKRGGAKRSPHYRIVAAERKNKRDGRNIEEIGYYHPCAKTPKFEVKVDRLKHYLDKGAVMSDTVSNFVKKNKVLEQED
ncbi:MAG: 30S ribosomal protein S16 [bacterium]|nr:30S ribosomal protein S16 [bacterium]